MGSGALIIAWANGQARDLPRWVWAIVIAEVALLTPGVIVTCLKLARAVLQ